MNANRFTRKLQRAKVDLTVRSTLRTKATATTNWAGGVETVTDTTTLTPTTSPAAQAPSMAPTPRSFQHISQAVRVGAARRPLGDAFYEPQG